jgi:hypothetical protein
MLDLRRVVTRPSLFATLLAAFLIIFPARSWAQETNSPSPAPSESAASPQQSPAVAPAVDTQDKDKQDRDKQDQDKPKDKDRDKNQINKEGTSDDRLFFALPNFLTVDNAGTVPPLTVGQKFKVELRSTVDWGQFAWYGVLSGLSQAENSEPGYGQGWQGYGKRYGAAVADGSIENFMVGAVMTSVFRQDPRYFELGKGGFWHRTFYSMSRIVVTRGDSGNNQFNASEIFGSAISAGISTYSYHPHDDKTLSNTASVWGTQIAYDTLSLVVKEFWPDIRRKIIRKK